VGTIEVREDGTIWRLIRDGRPITPRRIDLSDRNKGYRNVVLPLDGRWRTFKAHRLVWWWHHGDPGAYQVDHLNEDKADNRIDNLDLVDQAENMHRSYANGRRHPWSDATTWRGRPRITPQQKQNAMALRQRGASLKEIAVATGCSVTSAARITTADRRSPGE
jgi:hypothetical protein